MKRETLLRAVGAIITRTALVSLAAVWAMPAQAACTLGPGTPSAGESSLQQLFDAHLGTGALSAANDCVAGGNDIQWSAQNGASATLLVELAGNAAINAFGIYDLNHPNTHLQLFSGEAGAGMTTNIGVAALGGGAYKYTTTLGWDSSKSVSATFEGAKFGFYVTGADNQTLFSDPALNPGNFDTLYSYQLQDGTSLLAWEDLLREKGGDGDYQDMVLSVKGFTDAPPTTPVPVPAAVWLLGSGVLGLFGVRRRPTKISVRA